jgi:hypothetical protein
VPRRLDSNYFAPGGRVGGGAVNSDTVRYHQVCPEHGRVASAAVRKRAEPKTMACPVCGEFAELWVGMACELRMNALPFVDDTRRVS